MDRQEVYRAIDSERDYQDSLIEGGKFEQSVHSVAAEILMMEDYVARARKAFTDNYGDEAALEVVRKIAGLAVRCMEHHGVKSRQ
jgi:hypothetical protein